LELQPFEDQCKSATQNRRKDSRKVWNKSSWRGRGEKREVEMTNRQRAAIDAKSFETKVTRKENPAGRGMALGTVVRGGGAIVHRETAIKGA